MLHSVKHYTSAGGKRECLIAEAFVSGSMSGAAISELNKGLVVFQDELMADSMAQKRVEGGNRTTYLLPTLTQGGLDRTVRQQHNPYKQNKVDRCQQPSNRGSSGAFQPSVLRLIRVQSSGDGLSWMAPNGQGHYPMSTPSTALSRGRESNVMPGERVIWDSMGSELHGVDLTAPFSDSQFNEIRRIFCKRHLLVIPGQQIDADQLEAFAMRFGQPDPVVKTEANDGSFRKAVHSVSNLNAQGVPTISPVINANYFWHSDRAYRPKGSICTMLHGIEIPPSGGDTLFANLILAYKALPEVTKKRIDQLKVIHSYEFMRETIMKLPLTEEERKKQQPSEHSLVPIHPETGEKILFIGMYASEIVGMPLKEGRALLTELQEFATQPQFIFAHQWRAGDVVVWDNRCLVHKATDDYQMDKYRRVMRRVVVQGTAEF